jgi:hypothetical protein
LQPLLELFTDKANAKRLAEYVAKVKFDLPLHKKPGASRKARSAACQSPRPAQRGEGKGEGFKVRSQKPCPSLSSQARSKSVKPSLPRRGSAKAGQSKNSRLTGESGTAIGKCGDSSDPTDPTDPADQPNPQSAIRNGKSNFDQSAIESNPVAPSQSESTSLTSEGASAQNAPTPKDDAPQSAPAQTGSNQSVLSSEASAKEEIRNAQSAMAQLETAP